MSHIVDPNFPNSKINKSEFPIPMSLEIPVHCNHNPPMQASSLDPELDDLRFFSFLSFLLFLLFFLLLSFFSGFLVLMVSVWSCFISSEACFRAWVSLLWRVVNQRAASEALSWAATSSWIDLDRCVTQRDDKPKARRREQGQMNLVHVVAFMGKSSLKKKRFGQESCLRKETKEVCCEITDMLSMAATDRVFHPNQRSVKQPLSGFMLKWLTRS